MAYNGRGRGPRGRAGRKVKGRAQHGIRRMHRKNAPSRVRNKRGYGSAGPRGQGREFIIANGSGENKVWWACSTPSITTDCRNVTDQVNMNNYMNSKNQTG